MQFPPLRSEIEGRGKQTIRHARKQTKVETAPRAERVEMGVGKTGVVCVRNDYDQEVQSRVLGKRRLIMIR